MSKQPFAADRVIDCIACKAGIPTRPARRYIAR
jgi:hypothetical protein